MVDIVKKRRAGKRTVAIVGTSFLVLVGIGVAAIAGGGGGGPPPVPPEPDIPKPNPDINEPDPAPDPHPDPAPDPEPDGPLKFDLSNNWGGIPMSLRKELARMELAAQIPGLARFLGVKAWQAYRSHQPFVTPDVAAQIAADHPELCRNCGPTTGDAAASKALLDQGIANGWPKPVDYAGWAAGSYGLFDLLGGTAVYAGVHTDPKAQLPLVTAPNAAEMMRRYDAQGYAASYVVRRLMVSVKYKVLVPGAKAPPATQDPYNTWGNIGSAYAFPDDFSKNTQAAMDRKVQFLARSTEIGIDFAKNAFPWPEGRTFSAPTWTAGQVWKRLQDYKNRDVQDIGGVNIPADPNDPENSPDEGGQWTKYTGLPAQVITQLPAETWAPLVLLLHDANAKDTQLAALATNPGVRYALVRGDKSLSELLGYRFFDGGPLTPAAELGPQIEEATMKIVGTIQDLLGPGKVKATKVHVVGFGQGGALAYNLAAKPLSWWQGLGADTNLIGGMVAVAGYLPPPLRPTGPVPGSMVHAVQGADDKVVSSVLAQEAYNSFIGKTKTEWTLVPGAGHDFPQIVAEVSKAVQGLVGYIEPKPDPKPEPEPPPLDNPNNPPNLDELLDLAQGIRVRVLNQVEPNIEAPLVILLHGADATELQLLTTIPKDIAARFALLRAPIESAGKWRWYVGNHASPEQELVTAIDGAAQKVLSAIKALQSIYPQTTKTYLVGYSQGASVVYDLAGKTKGWWTAHGMDPLAGAVTIAGFLPLPLRPTTTTGIPELYAVHGQADVAVSLALDQAAYESFIFKTATSNNWVPGGTHALSTLRPAAQAFMKELIE